MLGVARFVEERAPVVRPADRLDHEDDPDFSDSLYLNVYLETLSVAAISTAMLLLIGYPMVSRCRVRRAGCRASCSC